MDVGKTNFYDITLKNSGTREATRLQLNGKLTKNLKVLKHFNVEKGEFQFKPGTGQFVFPEIDRLGVGQTITLSLEVQATESPARPAAMSSSPMRRWAPRTARSRTSSPPPSPATRGVAPPSRNLSVVSCRLSVVGCQLSVVGCRLPVVGCRLSVVGCRLSAKAKLGMASVDSLH